jgi:hypothetical protein
MLKTSIQTSIEPISESEFEHDEQYEFEAQKFYCDLAKEKNNYQKYVKLVLLDTL